MSPQSVLLAETASAVVALVAVYVSDSILPTTRLILVMLEVVAGNDIITHLTLAQFSKPNLGMNGQLEPRNAHGYFCFFGRSVVILCRLITSPSI